MACSRSDEPVTDGMQSYLLERQYRDPSQLVARQALHARFSTNRSNISSWIFDQLCLPDNGRILELGCGIGGLWATSLNRIPPGWDITLTDFSPGMIEEAKHRLGESRRGFTFRVVDAENLPHSDEYFDAVIANFMLYHVPNRTGALSEISRVLKPGGYLFAATNGENHLRELKQITEWLDSGRATSSAGPNPFTLENGPEQLQPWFEHVEERRYEDSLVITDVEPLIAYIMSTARAQEILDSLSPDEADARVALVRAKLELELERNGPIRVTKDPGLFVARKKALITQ